MAKNDERRKICRVEAAKSLAEVFGIPVNTVQQRIRQGLKKDGLRRVSESPQEFLVEDLADWAARKWPRCAAAICQTLGVKFSHKLAAKLLVHSTVQARAHSAPGTLPECQALVIAQAQRVELLEDENKKLLAECKRLRALEQRKAAESSAKSKAGRTGGRGNVKQ